MPRKSSTPDVGKIDIPVHLRLVIVLTLLLLLLLLTLNEFGGVSADFF